jgi:penicillin-binding protein 1A
LPPKKDYPQCAFVALDQTDNAILAWSGGRDYTAAPFNNQGGRLVARRQPGSAFKTFAYALAMENGMAPDQILTDEPITLLDDQGNWWTPDNYASQFYGPTILKQMLVKSLNSMAVRLVNEYLGTEALAALALNSGITTPLPPLPSLVLGTVEVTPLEMGAAYGTFGRQGQSAGPPFAIRCITDTKGDTVYRHATATAQAVINPVSAFLVLDALKAVINQGTAKRIRQQVNFSDLAGKTGTSAAYRDAWFIGLTPRVSTSAWIGYDNDQPLTNPHSGRSLGGGTSAAVLTGAFWQHYPEALSDNFWTLPAEALLSFKVDPRTGEPDALNPAAVDIPYVLRSYLAATPDNASDGKEQQP